jgi:endonuclease YncB( thermonuclease family)
MIDDQTTHDSPTDSLRHWTRLTERMREVIRGEIDKIHPTDDARRALELIIESSLRPSEVDGVFKLTVIDQNGQPRMIEKDGARTEFTLDDLIDEFRVRYPILFRRAKTNPATLGQPEEPPKQQEKPKRDWLSLDTSEPKSETADGPATPAPLQPEPAPADADTGRVRIHDWSRNALKVLKPAPATGPAAMGPAVTGSAPTSPVPTSHTPKAQAAGGPTPLAVEHDRNAPGGMRERSWARPGLAVAAVGLLALLGVGAFLFRDDEPAAPQASVTQPAETATADATPLREPEPSTTGSTASSASLRGVPDVIDTATLSLKGEVVRLFGVEWAPGGGKPEDLTRYLQGREVSCEPAGGNDTYRCQVGGQDLSRVVLFNGGGQPTADATPELKAAADKAREAKIGVWNKQQ